MKIVFASTPLQEKEIRELIHDFYSEILPQYFSDEDIVRFKELNILHVGDMQEVYHGTLKEAFQVISSLQVLKALIETIRPDNVTDRHHKIFIKNEKILNEYQLSFPFKLEQFITAKTHTFSEYSQPTNRYII
ncbi:DUF5365 family protein [Bacillus sp. SCS-151]|uniref:DUF5365 family protein n=1 Tax=Nanhaiella sioensis TaxID=3115293 RepID=UPI003978C983